MRNIVVFIIVIFLFQMSLFAQTSSQDKDLLWQQFIKNTGEITREFKPDAWKQYSVDETLIKLYSKKDVVLDKKIDLHFDPVGVKIKTDLQVKSIAILQERKKRTSLVTFIQTDNNPHVNISIPVAVATCAKPTVTVVLEDSDGVLHMNQVQYTGDGKCEEENDDAYDGRLSPYSSNRNLLPTSYQPRIKAKVNHTNIGSDIRLLILDNPIGYDEAYREKTVVEYIDSISIIVNNKPIYKIYFSQYNKSGLVKVRTHLIQDNEKIVIEMRDIHNNIFKKKVY